MLKHRVITSAVFVSLLALAIWFGTPWFSLLIAGAALAGAYEFYRMANLDKKDPMLYLGLVWALALVLRHHYQSGDPGIPAITITAFMLASLVWLLRRPPGERTFRTWAWTIAGALYVGWMLSYWLSLRGLDDGRTWVYLSILTVFANDTGSFFIGRARGKHTLAPAISPGKTREGAVGGLICAISGAIVIALVLNLISPFSVEYWQIIILGFLVSLSAQVGDLVESLLKRSLGVKESGSLLPGHGGILDRFDSIIFVGPVLYYYITWVII